MRLAVILAQPPLTSGERTRARVAMAARLLGAGEVRTANLFATAGRSVVDMTIQGASEAPWHAARPALSHTVWWSTDVLLAYGVREPTGRARIHHREQLGWLLDTITARGSATYLVGGQARHPSRWQRWTSRVHPGHQFEDALRLELMTPA